MATTYVPRTLGSTLLLTPTSMPVQVSRDLFCRVIIARNPSEGIILVPQYGIISPAALSGGTIPVLLPPVLPYSVNGIVLDSQPTTRTAPFSTSSVIPAGSSFTLTFAPASTTTQTLLSQGSVVVLRFGLVDGGSATGLVQVVVAGLVGTTIITSLVVLQSIVRGNSVLAHRSHEFLVYASTW